MSMRATSKLERLMNLEGYTVCTRHLVKYPDCNATTNLFGGKLLAWIDEGVAIHASKYMRSDMIVTAHFGEMNFKVPTPLRSVVTIYAKVIREGRTSLTVHGVATKRTMGSSEETVIADTELVFVSVDENMRPIPWSKE